MTCLVECANGDTISLVYFSATTLPHLEDLSRALVQSLHDSGKDVAVIVQDRSQAGEIPIRREWSVDLKGSIPIWVFQRWHRVCGRGLSGIVNGKLLEAMQGDIIRQNQIGEFSISKP